MRSRRRSKHPACFSNPKAQLRPGFPIDTVNSLTFRTLLLAVLALPAFAQAQDQCTAQYNAEVARINRDARPTKGGNLQAEMARRENTEKLLQDAAVRADRCRTAEQGVKFSPTGSPGEKYCHEQSNRRQVELTKSYSARNLSESELQLLNAERVQIRRELNACLQNQR